jgi:tetratricopeptide (TPR) repeat protein
MRQLNDVGVALNRAGDSEGALATYEPLLEDRRNNLPQPHEDVASTLINIGMLKAGQGLLHEVGPMYEEAIGIREAVLAQKDDDDPEKKQILRDVAESHGNLGALSMDLGRPREAVLSHRRALDIYEGLEETENERYANTSMALGAALGLHGDFEGARSRQERALCVHRRVLQEENWRIAKNLILLGALLAEEAEHEGGPTAAQRREILDAARGHLQEALNFLGRFLEGDNPLPAGVMRVAANVAEAEGRHDDASFLREQSDVIRGPSSGARTRTSSARERRSSRPAVSTTRPRSTDGGRWISVNPRPKMGALRLR